MSGSASINEICEAIHRASPLVLNPSARAKPPPKRSNIPQGSFTALAQSIIWAPLVLEGNKNNANALARAMIVSSMAGMKCFNMKDRVIHKKAVITKTMSTVFSS